MYYVPIYSSLPNKRRPTRINFPNFSQGYALIRKATLNNFSDQTACLRLLDLRESDHIALCSKKYIENF